MRKHTSKTLVALAIFSAFGSANAEIASKAYVDAQNSGQTTAISNLETSVSSIESNVTNLSTTVATKADAVAVANELAGKADLLGTGAAGEIATVDASGQYVRSGTSVANLATTENVNTIVNNAINDAVDDVADSMSNIYETKVNVANGLSGKADKDNTYTKEEVGTALKEHAYSKSETDNAIVNATGNKADKVAGAANGNLAGLDASGNLTDSGVSATGIASIQSDVTSVQNAINNKADKATTIAGYGITDAYTKTETDNALLAKVNDADLGALAKAAPGACANPASKCVLTFNGTIYEWEIIER